MTVVLVSFFNTSNLGDRLISKSLIESVSKYDKNIIPIDFSGNNNFKLQTDIRTEENQVNNEKNSTLVKDFIISGIDRIGLGGLLSKRAHENSKFRNKLYEEEILNADTLIIGGGNMIFDLSSNYMWSGIFGYYVNFAKSNNKKIFAISLGIGPFSNNYQYSYATQSLAQCDYVTFRDFNSLNLFEAMQPSYRNVGVVPDPVFFLEQSKNETMQSDKGKIGINIINSSLFNKELDYKKIINGYTKLIEEIILKTGKQVIIFNTEQHDFTACEDVYKLLNQKANCELLEVSNLDDLFAIYQQIDLLVGTRMHSLITAFSQHIPIIGLSWQQKVNSMFNVIEKEDAVFDLVNINNEIDTIVEKVSEILLFTDKKSYFNVFSKLHDMNLKNETILKNLLEE